MKTTIYIKTLYIGLLTAPLFLAGCNGMPSLWQDNEPNYYPNNNTNIHHHKDAYGNRMPKARVESNHYEGSKTTTAKVKAANTTAQVANDNLNTTNAVGTKNTVMPKASTTAGSTMDSPIVPTTTPAMAE